MKEKKTKPSIVSLTQSASLTDPAISSIPVSLEKKTKQNPSPNRPPSLPQPFCSNSSDRSGSGSRSQLVIEIELKGAESESNGFDSKASSAIVPTNPRPEDYLTVLALPLLYRPLFPGFYMPIYVKLKLLHVDAKRIQRQL